MINHPTFQALKDQIKKYALIASIIIGIVGISLAVPGLLDFFGPPPPGDPSEFRELLVGEEFAGDVLETLPHANEGAFEGGATGTDLDAGINNVVPEDAQRSGKKFNIPTNSLPSPLFGAISFDQPILRFEEFGTEPLDSNLSAPTIAFAPPTLGPAPEQDPVDIASSGPAGAALDAFLSQDGIAPFPTKVANTTDENPWKATIEAFLGRSLITPPAEGRPPGQGWAHQRWNEFTPQVFFKTAMAGARVNGGIRDKIQRHRYTVGEFAQGGLYHNYTGIPGEDATTKGIAIRFHPAMPIQGHKTLWTFDGTLPPKLLMVRYGQGVLMRHYNALPIDPSANRGFGLHTISTHEHNGHTPAESDGYTNAFYFPGQFYDYRWPIQLASYDTINTDASDPRAAFPCSPGETLFTNGLPMGEKPCENGSIKIRGDWRETMSTHWFHDHMLDFTAQNVYKGNAAMMNYYSALDRGKEDHDDGVNLRFPSGTDLAWGNRDFDVNLLIADKAWDQTGQLWFNIFNTNGFLGDHLLTNWLYHPYMDVRARRYRFRILNGAVSRYLTLALVHQVEGPKGELPGPSGSGISYNRVPFHMILNDGNVMEHAIPFDGSMDLDGDGDLLDHKGQLPTQAIAERYDIIVDFSKHGIHTGDKLYFVNLLEHNDGRGPNERIPLADVLAERYKAIMEDSDDNGGANQWIDGDPAVGKFLELEVHAYAGTDLSMDPSEYEPGKKTMIPLPIDRNDPQLAQALHRTFSFGRSSGTDSAPWTIKTDGGSGFTMDPRRISAAPALATGPTLAGFDGTNSAGDDGVGTVEIWNILNGGGGWSHPVHVHFEEGVIIRRGGKPPPAWEMWARKDIYRIGTMDDSTDSVEMAIRFREFAGTYMEHCHNTQHEDRAMLMRYDVEHPGQLTLMPTPLPTWDGVEFVNSAALPTFRGGDGKGPSDKVIGVNLLESQGASPDEYIYTASALAGKAPYEYRFLFYKPTIGWSVVQEYATTDTWTLNTKDLPDGIYRVAVYARSQGATAQFEAFNIVDLTVGSAIRPKPTQPAGDLEPPPVLPTVTDTSGSSATAGASDGDGSGCFISATMTW